MLPVIWFAQALDPYRAPVLPFAELPAPEGSRAGGGGHEPQRAAGDVEGGGHRGGAARKQVEAAGVAPPTAGACCFSSSSKALPDQQLEGVTFPAVGAVLAV